MGWSLHITRRAFWADDDDAIISLDEWCDCAEADPDLIARSKNVDVKGQMEGTFGYVTSQGDEWPLQWSEGNVLVDRPPDDLIAKMSFIAAKLDAVVMDDDGGRYDSEGNWVEPEQQIGVQKIRQIFHNRLRQLLRG
ncbi:hypothetical protein [uncultured Tateyamaria sp.]|uniref:hypothetical protein n=1 Tax=uncultured Tateyamaria sp. TaxID=455651 RepID=UPI0026354A4A|nr:hypothetical protein [uncultured Tateyamaria sp.]